MIPQVKGFVDLDDVIAFYAKQASIFAIMCEEMANGVPNVQKFVDKAKAAAFDALQATTLEQAEIAVTEAETCYNLISWKRDEYFSS